MASASTGAAPLAAEKSSRAPELQDALNRRLYHPLARRLAREEGIFAGISAAGACWVAQEIARTVENATIVFVVCDRGDRYLSTGVFPA